MATTSPTPEPATIARGAAPKRSICSPRTDFGHADRPVRLPDHTIRRCRQEIIREAEHWTALIGSRVSRDFLGALGNDVHAQNTGPGLGEGVRGLTPDPGAGAGDHVGL